MQNITALHFTQERHSDLSGTENPGNMENMETLMSREDIDLENELRRMRADPILELEKLRDEVGVFEEKMNAARYRYIALIIGVYYQINKDDSIKNEFTNLCLQKGQKRKIIKKDLLLSVFKYVLKAKNNGPMYERARVYARAVRAMVDSQINPADIPELISKANGIEELYTHQRSKLDDSKSEIEVASPHLDERGDGADKNGCDDDDDDDDDGILSLQPPPPPKSFKMKFDPRKDLKITCATEGELSEIFKSKRRSATLEVEFSYPEGKPVEITLRKFLLK